MRGIQIGTVLLTLTGCPRGGTQPPTPTPTTTTASDDAPAPDGEATTSSGSECVSLVEAPVADDAHARGVAALEESYDGEHYHSGPFEEAMGALRIAAEQGHRGAQSLYGRTLASVRFSKQAPVDEEREDYVSAFSFARIAALRGDTEAAAFLASVLVDAATPRGEPPFDQIPAPWLSDAFERADAWMACHGEAAGDRGVVSVEPPHAG